MDRLRRTVYAAVAMLALLPFAYFLNIWPLYIPIAILWGYGFWNGMMMDKEAA